tara:strand:- start:778 stop:990 length:213 start_codon:yes stop_codon:yes gene_type:complete
MNNKQYRKKEFEKINTVYNDYKTKLKFIKPNGETNWLDINNKELEKIINLLTDYKLDYNNYGEFELINNK